MKLTNTKVRALAAPASGQALHWCDETRGFGVRVTASGAKSWVVQSRVNGKTRRATIGKIELLTADDARRRAQTILLEMYDGKDPRAEKLRARSKTETLRTVMEDYVQNKTTKNGPLRPGSKRDYRNVVEVVFEDWADKPVSSITRDACVKKFRTMTLKAPVMTNQSFRYLRALLNWAREKSANEDGSYTILQVNPVAQMLQNGGLVQWNPEKPRTTRLALNKVGAVWCRLLELADSETNLKTTRTSADLIMFMLLTGARKGEATQLTWNRVDLTAKVPCFHFDVTKNHNPITLPISSVLMTVLLRRLDAKVQGNDYVFPASRGNTGYLKDCRATLRKVVKLAESHVHPHALRRTFDDIGLEVGVDGDQRRQLLNHTANDVHGRSYANNPDPERLLKAAEDIGNWVIGQSRIAAQVAKGENVVAINS